VNLELYFLPQITHVTLFHSVFIGFLLVKIAYENGCLQKLFCGQPQKGIGRSQPSLARAKFLLERSDFHLQRVTLSNYIIKLNAVLIAARAAGGTKFAPLGVCHYFVGSCRVH
jgi:hypothetical protein